MNQKLDTQFISDTYRNALGRISGVNGEPGQQDFKDAVRDLSKIADVFPGAKAKLAVLTQLGAGTAQDSATAVALFLAATQSGLPPLARELAIMILIASTDNHEYDGLAGALLKQAALAGDWIAAFLIVREAGRGRYFLRKQNLLRLAQNLSNDVPFRADIQTITSALPDDITPIPDMPYDHDLCASILSLDPIKPQPDSNFLHLNAPSVKSYAGVISPLACDYLIASSTALMRPSKVVDADLATAKAQGYRTSDGAVFLPHTLDRPLIKIISKISVAAGVQPHHCEFLSLLRYKPGQEYFPHHDFLKQDAADYSKVKTCGQRYATVLTYLNEDYNGGETNFPDLNISFKGNSGDSLFFSNTDTNGVPIPNSRHAGRAVTSGEKWLATLWVREKPFWPWMKL